MPFLKFLCRLISMIAFPSSGEAGLLYSFYILHDRSVGSLSPWRVAIPGLEKPGDGFFGIISISAFGTGIVRKLRGLSQHADEGTETVLDIKLF